MTTKHSIPRYTFKEVDLVYQTLLDADLSLKNRFELFIDEEYRNGRLDRLHYFDIAEIGRYIVEKLQYNDTDNFRVFFEKVEEILDSCDSDIENLIVVGLFEGIQNIGGHNINYYSGFNKWLKPLSKQAWDSLIDFWEGIEWRNKPET